MVTTKLTAHIETARGHGPNGIIPQEKVWCELEINGSDASNLPPKVATHPKPVNHPNKIWCETLNILIDSANAKVLKVTVYGEMPGKSHPGVDVVGTGSISLTEVLESGSKQTVIVPLTAGGKPAGEVEMVLQHHATPEV